MINVAPPLLESREEDYTMDPVVLDVALEVIKAIVGVVIPALTIALTFYTKRLNDKLKRKSLKDEIHRLTQFAEETESFKLMNTKEKEETLLESMKVFVVQNDITISDAELELLVERALQSERNLRMRFKLLDENRREK